VNVIKSYLINNLAVENPDDRLTVAEIKTQHTKRRRIIIIIIPTPNTQHAKLHVLCLFPGEFVSTASTMINLVLLAFILLAFSPTSSLAESTSDALEIATREIQWDQKGKDIYSEATGDRSGHVSLSNDGTVVAIGATGNDGVNGTDSGHVRVYDWVSSSWVQRGDDIDGEDSEDLSGGSVGLSNDGTVVAIGAYGNDNENGWSSGHVRIHAWNSSSWVQMGADIDGEASHDWSGRSLSLSNDGTVVAIGAPYNDGVNRSSHGLDPGHVRIYAWNSSSWVQMGADIDGEANDNLSGYSVSLSNDGTVIAIGATYNDGVNGSDSGHVRIYAWNSTSWVQMGADIDGEAADDYSGESVSISNDGTVIAIGANFNDKKFGPTGRSSGHVRIYAWDSTIWVQRGADIDGEAAYDWSGGSVSLSNDGTVVAIGAPGNDGNGFKSGHVRVYAWNSPSWIQRGADIDGDADNSRLGGRVSLSNDGTVVAIGAYGDDGNGSVTSYVRLYSIVLSEEPMEGMSTKSPNSMRSTKAPEVSTKAPKSSKAPKSTKAPKETKSSKSPKESTKAPKSTKVKSPKATPAPKEGAAPITSGAVSMALSAAAASAVALVVDFAL
jgi:hypothetical protein